MLSYKYFSLGVRLLVLASMLVHQNPSGTAGAMADMLGAIEHRLIPSNAAEVFEVFLSTRHTISEDAPCRSTTSAPMVGLLE